MNLPFSHDAFLDVFGAYNGRFWPLAGALARNGLGLIPAALVLAPDIEAPSRLPVWARDLADTDDLLQEALVQTFKKVESFEPRGVGAKGRGLSVFPVSRSSPANRPTLHSP